MIKIITLPTYTLYLILRLIFRLVLLKKPLFKNKINMEDWYYSSTEVNIIFSTFSWVMLALYITLIFKYYV